MNDEIDIEEFAPWFVIFITLAGGFMRVLLLANKGMGMDETFSVWLANHSVAGLLQWVVKAGQNPPLYYLLLHYWIALTNDAPYYVRLLSVLFGTATIPIVYLIGKRMSGAVMGLAAAVFLALSPFHIQYAQETGMYTFLTFNAAIAMLALVRLLTDPRSSKPIGSQFLAYLRAWRTSEAAGPTGESGSSDTDESLRPPARRAWVFRHRWLPIQSIETDLAWVAWIVFSAATLLSHNTAILFVLAANIFVLGLMIFQRVKRSGTQTAFQPPTFWNWVKADIGIFILWIPWIIPFLQQASMVYQRFWIPAPTWQSVVQVLGSFLNTSAALPANIATVIWILYGLGFVLGLVYFRKKSSQFFFLAALLVIPILGELFVSIWRPVFLDRTLIWITIPLFLVLAAGIAQLKFRFVMIVALGGLSFISLFSAGDYYRFYQKEDWNTAARDVAGYAEKGDLVLFNTNFGEIPFDYYFKPYETYYSIQVEKRGLPLDLLDSGTLEPEMTSSDIPGLTALLQGHNRVWLIYSHNGYTDPQGLIPKTLASQMKLSQTDNFNGGQVQLYVSP